jgi:pantoate--beta-alanine ligase
VKIVERIAEVRAECDAARARGERVGLVPTMGAFHAGHRSLMHAGRTDCDLLVVSLFVNPTQFGPNEDLAGYPRDLEGDAAIARADGVDLLFTPSVDEMYPDGPTCTTVHVAGLTEGLCGATRPTHFDGVTTVVTKLLSIVGPCRAYFGRKDFQQLAVVTRMARDLDLPVEVIGCPLVREPDGLAMSSRNAYLTPDERVAARVLSAALRDASDAIVAGERDAERAETIVRDAVDAEPRAELVYAEVRDAKSLRAVDRIDGECVLALAAQVGRARLLDNVVVDVRGDAVHVDLGVRVGEEGR